MAAIAKLSLLLTGIVLIQGCASYTVATRDDMPAKDVSVAPGDIIQGESQLPTERNKASDEAVPSSAVIALLDLSEQQQQAGRIEHAVATIERALRLDPKNPLLWTRLANLILTQGNWQQAYVLANKSNSLSRDNEALRLQNWRIIEMAKTRQGDTVAAEEARIQIRALSE
jgi:tetratricopeptide (TPR) repeat protein